MKRLLFAAAALLCAAGLAVPVPGQMTPVSATQLKMGGALIPSGTVTFTAVNSIGVAIPVITSDGSLNAPEGYSATITNGVIANGFTVPDQVTSVAATPNTPISYQVSVYNSANKNSFTLVIPYTDPAVTGSSPFALDHYTPAQTAFVSAVSIITSASAPAHCTGAQLWYNNAVNPSTLEPCVGGVFVPLNSSGSGASLPSGSGILKVVSGTAGLANPGTDFATPAAIASESTRAQAAEASISSAAANASNLTTGTVPNQRLSAIPNSSLAQSSITFNGTPVALGGHIDFAAGSGAAAGTAFTPQVQDPSAAGVLTPWANMTSNANGDLTLQAFLSAAKTNGTYQEARYSNILAAFAAAPSLALVHSEPDNTNNDYYVPYSNEFYTAYSAQSLWPEGSRLLDERRGQTMRLAYHPGRNVDAFTLDTDEVSFGESGGERTGNSTNQYHTQYNTNFFGNGFSQGSPWSVGKALNAVTNIFKMGIHQGISNTVNCYALGDCRAYYSYTRLNPGASSPSDEGGGGLTNQVYIEGPTWGTAAANISAAPATATYAKQAGMGPAAGLYVYPETNSTTYYVSSVAAANGSDHIWSQYATITGATAPAVSSVKGSILSCDNPSPSSIPIVRHCTVSVTALAASAYTTGLACISGPYVDTATITAVGAVSGGQQSITMTSPKAVYSAPELWQGGPCGKAVVLLNGHSSSEAFATHNTTLLPVAGSPSSGVLAIASSFLGGQQGPGYGITKQDFTRSGVSFSRASNSVVANGLDMSALAVPLPSQVTATVSAADSSFNGAISHTSDSPAVTVVPGTSVSNKLSSDTQVTYAQTGSNASSTGTITIQGYDNVALVDAAEVLKVDEPTVGNPFPITFNANSLPAIASGAALDQAHYWQVQAEGEFLTYTDNSSNAHRGAAYANPALKVWASMSGSGLEMRSFGGPSTPWSSLLNFSGFSSNGILMDGPSGGLSTPAGLHSAWHVRCPAYSYYGNCTGAPNETYEAIGHDTNIGVSAKNLNAATGAEYYTGAGFAYSYLTPVGQANPFVLDGSTQLVANRSQALTFPYGLTAPRINSLSGTGLFLNSYISAIHLFDSDLNQPMGICPCTDQTNQNGLAMGELDAGMFHSNAPSIFAGVQSGVAPPVYAAGTFAQGGTAVQGHTSISIAASSGNTGSTGRAYYVSALSLWGETPVSASSAMFANNQAATLSASAYNTITCTTYLQAPGQTGYNLYVQESGTLFLIGACPVSGTVVDDGSHRNTPTRQLNSRNLSAPLEGAQINLFGHSVRFLDSLDPNVTTSHAGVSDTPTGISADSTTERDGNGTITGSVLKLNTAAGLSCSSANRGTFNYVAGGAGVKDTVQVCAKDASDAYAWRPIY